MAKASQILSLFVAVAFAATAIFCCIPTASASQLDPMVSSHSDSMTDHCGDDQVQDDIACEFENTLAKSIPQPQTLAFPALSHAEIPTVAAELRQESKAAALAVPLPPTLRNLTPVSLFTQLRT